MSTWIKSLAIVSVVFFLVLAAIAVPTLGMAADTSTALAYPPAGLPDNGGRLGVKLDTKSYVYNGINVVKVLEVMPASRLSGVIHAGDFIYGVNGFNLRGQADVGAVVSSGSPGKVATVWYLDSRHSYQGMKTSVATISEADMRDDRLAETSPAQTREAQSSTFCDEHPILCGIVVLVTVAVVAKKVSDSANGSEYSSDSSDSSSLLQCRDVPSGYASDGGVLYQHQCDRDPQD